MINLPTDIWERTERGLCWSDFWYFASFLKTRDEATGMVRPFPVHYDFLHRIDQEGSAANVAMYCKARQMILSWFMCSKRLYRALRAAYLDEVYSGGVVSKREDDAKELAARIGFMYDNLPAFLRHPTAERTKTIISFSDKSRVICFPAGANIGRTFTFTDFLLDEWAFAPHAREMWNAIAPTIGRENRLDIVSTPNGKFNLYHDQWHDASNDFAKVRLHWSEHPERGEDWATEMRKRYTRQEDWDREMELSFIGYPGKRVYGNFEVNTHARTIDFRPKSETVVYRGWDFGYHFPACVWMVRDDRDRLLILRELLGEDVFIGEFKKRVVDISKAEFPNCVFRDFCDPAGAHVKDTASEKSEKSSIDVLRSEPDPIMPEFRPTNISEGLEVCRQLLAIRDDGSPGLLIDSERCPVLVDAFLGGYHYPDKDVPGELPEKDGYYDHLCDALRYILVNIKLRPRRGKPGPPVYAGQPPRTWEAIERERVKRGGGLVTVGRRIGR